MDLGFSALVLIVPEMSVSNPAQFLQKKIQETAEIKGKAAYPAQIVLVCL